MASAYFVFLEQRLVLVDQLVVLRLHILYFIVVLGGGTIKLGLEHGGVHPGLSEFFLQCLCSEHCVAIPLEHIGLLLGSLHDILQKATIIRVLTSERFRLLKSTDTYLHPLLGPPHRFQVAG
jgi:hypothetical protein